MKRFLTTPVVALVLLIWSTVIPRVAGAQTQRTWSADILPGKSIRIDTITHGVKLSLVVSHNTYPQDALISVLLILRNMTSSNVYTVNGAGSPCPTSPLGVQVVTRTGAILPAGPIVPIFASCSPFTTTPQLQLSGSGTLVYAPAVLHGTGLRAEAWLRVNGATVEIYSGILHLNVVRTPPPMLRIEKRGGRVYAVFTPKLRGYGSLAYSESYTCPHSVGGSMFVNHPHSTNGWSASRSLRFTTPCTVPRQWNLVAGYLNHPVATLQYRSL